MLRRESYRRVRCASCIHCLLFTGTHSAKKDETKKKQGSPPPVRPSHLSSHAARSHTCASAHLPPSVQAQDGDEARGSHLFPHGVLPRARHPEPARPWSKKSRHASPPPADGAYYSFDVLVYRETCIATPNPGQRNARTILFERAIHASLAGGGASDAPVLEGLERDVSVWSPRAGCLAKKLGDAAKRAREWVLVLRTLLPRQPSCI